MVCTSIEAAFPAAYKRLGRDVYLLKEIARIYLEDAPSLLLLVRNGCEKGDLELVATASHKLKGLTANLDENLAAVAVQPVIDAARNRQLEQTRRLCLDLQRHSECLTRRLDELVQD